MNSKIYSRRVAAELGLAQAAGLGVRDGRGVRRRRRAGPGLAGGPDGGSGSRTRSGSRARASWSIDDEQRLDQLVRMVTRRAERSGDQRVALVVEEWADKALDLNYHFTVGRDGSVRFDFVKEALTEGGVHKGHRIPARITDAHRAEIERCRRRDRGAAGRGTGSTAWPGWTRSSPATAACCRCWRSTPATTCRPTRPRLQERFMAGGRSPWPASTTCCCTGPLSFARLREQPRRPAVRPARPNAGCWSTTSPPSTRPRPQAGLRPTLQRPAVRPAAGRRRDELTELDAAITAGCAG